MVLPDGGIGILHPIYIDDVVTGILEAARHGRIGEVYILAGDESVTVREFFGKYAEMLGLRDLRSAPSWMVMTIATLSEWASKLTGKPPRYTRTAVRVITRRTSYRCNKARKELGFKPVVSFEVGMEKIRHWLQTSNLRN